MHYIKASTQPYCRWCAKPIRKHTIQVRVAKTEAELPKSNYRSDYDRWVVGNPQTKAECQALVNEQVVSLQRNWRWDSYTGERESKPHGYYSFNVWDGETYLAVYDYFCSGTCAMAMGRSAVRDHDLASTVYNTQMKKHRS